MFLHVVQKSYIKLLFKILLIIKTCRSFSSYSISHRSPWIRSVKNISHFATLKINDINKKTLLKLNKDDIDKETVLELDNLKSSMTVFALVSLLILGPFTHDCKAFEASDYASDTITSIVKVLEDSSGNREKSFSAFEEVRDIITEGKGVGGSVSYGSVQLTRGEIADEDTTIYNPGLSLLTESEKERLTDAIIRNKQSCLGANQWSDDNQSAFDYLKGKLDPFHIYELRGYFKIIPFFIAAMYVFVLLIQQNIRGAFPFAYFLAVGLLFGPFVVLIATGQ